MMGKAVDPTSFERYSLVPVVTPPGLTRLPLLIIFGYVVSTFLLFLTWPIDWPIYGFSSWVRLVAYVSLCLAVIAIASFKGSAGSTPVTAPLPYLSVWLPLGAIVAALILIPSSYVYTRHGPWDFLEALKDQGAAYRRLQQQLFLTSGQRNNLVAIRTALAPLIYAILPLGIVRWRSLGASAKLSVGVVVATSVIFSIMRGTDKEVADLFVVGTAAGFVALGRTTVVSGYGRKLTQHSSRIALVAVFFLLFAQSLYTERKEQRLGGYASRTVLCANNSSICANLENGMISWLPLRQRFGLTEFILSTSSGYYGLELALEKPFDSTFGVGHSPAAMSVYEALTDDTSLHKRTYTYRNDADGWPEEFYWSTLIAWIANDVGFTGAVLVLGLIGFMWGWWWREAAAGMSDPAAVLFVLTTTMIFYLPANDQVLAGYEGYTIYAVWLAIWLWHRSHRSLSAVVASSSQSAG